MDIDSDAYTEHLVALSHECDRRLAGLLAHGTAMDRAYAKAITELNSRA
ncbi:hypothetical protein [Mycobacterium europaeum]|nr:hypothetical protein [Mycobacterium europaeum]